MHSVGSRSYPLTRALVVGGYVIAVEQARAWLVAPGAAPTALVLGGLALGAVPL